MWPTHVPGAGGGMGGARGFGTDGLCCMPPSVQSVLGICRHKSFDAFILTIICFSSLVLAMENPGTTDPDTHPQMVQFFTVTEIIFASIFVVECILKVLALGFVLHPDTYLRDPWNVLDFIVVLGSVADLASRVAESSEDNSFAVVRTLRLLRVLRPLRMIKRNSGIKLVVNALLKSFSALLNIMLVLFFVWCVRATPRARVHPVCQHVCACVCQPTRVCLRVSRGSRGCRLRARSLTPPPMCSRLLFLAAG